MTANPHLAGIAPPPRCATCPHHPRLLQDGRCIDCGDPNAPVHATAPVAVPDQRPSTGLSPPAAFPDWMRQPIPGGPMVPASANTQQRGGQDTAPKLSPGRQQDRSSATTTREGPQRPDASCTDGATAGNAPHGARTHYKPSTNGHAARDPHTSSTRGRASRKRKAAEAVDVDTWALCERINVGALADLASRRRAATWHPGKDGQGPSLRQIIADILSQVNDGTLTVCFAEERQMTSLGQRGRRYSGYKAEFAIDSFDRHIAEGVNPGSVGRSLFWFAWLVEGRCTQRSTQLLRA